MEFRLVKGVLSLLSKRWNICHAMGSKDGRKKEKDHIEYRTPRLGLALWCQIIYFFGRSPFGKCHILQIFSKIFFFTVQKLIFYFIINVVVIMCFVGFFLHT
jgi:hypothetical protein